MLPTPRGRNPFQVFILVACVISGATTLCGYAEPSSVQSTVPQAVLILWAVALAFGGAIALIGVAIRPPAGLLVERIGMVLLAGPALSYAGALLYVGERRAVVSGAVVAAFGIAAVWRAVHITVDLRHFRR